MTALSSLSVQILEFDSDCVLPVDCSDEIEDGGADDKETDELDDGDGDGVDATDEGHTVP